MTIDNNDVFIPLFDQSERVACLSDFDFQDKLWDERNAIFKDKKFRKLYENYTNWVNQNPNCITKDLMYHTLRYHQDGLIETRFLPYILDHLHWLKMGHI